MTNNKPLFTIFLIVFIDVLGFGIILPLLPFIAESFKADPVHIGLLASTYPFFQFVASPILGRLSDEFGRKKLLAISQFGSFLGFILLGIANSMPLLFLSRVIDGTTGGNISIAQAYIADITDKKNRAKAMGVLGAAFGLGFILGPAIGGLLSQISYSAPAFLAAGVSLVTVFTTMFFLKETVKIKPSNRPKFNLDELKKMLGTKTIVSLTAVFLLVSLAFSLMQGVFALWAQKKYGWGPEENGLIFMIIGIGAVITQLKILPYIVDKKGERWTLKFGSLVLSLGFLFLTFSKTPALIFIPLILMVLGNGLSNPTIQSIASENVEKESYGGTLGFLQSSSSLGRIIGPSLGGFLFGRAHFEAPFIMAFILVFISFLVLRKTIT